MAEILDFNAARAKRLAEDDAFEGLDALIAADLAAEEKLPRERLSPESLAELRIDLIAAMSGAGARNTDRVSVLHSVLYAMVRELLDQRAVQRAVTGAWAAYVAREIQQLDFQNAIGLMAESGPLIEQLEILCNLAVELDGINGVR